MFYERKTDYLVCIDSDGTIMDTMTIKHVRAFGPMFPKAFNITTNVEEILNEWNRLNLYSKTRGINRFQGLKEIIIYCHKHYGFEVEGFEEFKTWVETTNKLSPSSLQEALKTAKNPVCMELAIKWSNMVNEVIVSLPETDAFKGIGDTFDINKDLVDFVGVSSANKDAVIEEWTRLGFISKFKAVCCQDVGTKKEIIEKALSLGYELNKTVMLGDAIGDLQAAFDNKVWFFPIVPGHENESWIRFKNEGIKKLLDGTFNQEYQNQLIEEFYNCLK